MNPRELVDHIRSGPAKLVLEEPLPRFRRRSRSNPCDFNEFLQALQSSETIRTVECGHHQKLSVTEDGWVRLVKTVGNIKGIQCLEFLCTHGSRLFDPFQAVADAVNNARSLCELEINMEGEALPIDSPGLNSLANALREHTTLKRFACVDFSHGQLEAVRNIALNPVLRALPACPHLLEVVIMARYACCNAMRNLLHLRPATELHLVLERDQWLAVADEIRQGRCNVQTLKLTILQNTRSEATEVIKAAATAIQLDRSLECLTLEIQNGFTDEEGVALAEALTVNTTLYMISLAVYSPPEQVRNRERLGAQSYKAFAAMLRVNTSLSLELPEFETSGADEMLVDSRNQMLIEQRLNEVGRGRLLASSQTTKEEWVDALHELNYDDVDDEQPEALRVSCMYSLLHLNPSELFACPS
jgi:hypothetical protein